MVVCRFMSKYLTVRSKLTSQVKNSFRYMFERERERERENTRRMGNDKLFLNILQFMCEALHFELVFSNLGLA